MNPFSLGKQVLGALGSSPVAKRLGQFCEFLESEQIRGVQDELFADNPDSIFALLYGEYCFRQSYFQKGKYIGKLHRISYILRKLITNNTEKIRSELWQLHSISRIIAECTHHQVQHAVRKEGVVILQLLIECFGSDIPEDVICLLVHAVDFTPYSLSYPLPTPYFPLPKSYMEIDPQNIIFPAAARSEETKKEESGEVLRIVFSFLENVSLERFQIWLDALKMTYFALLFPKPCQEMQIVEGGDLGFAVCPPDLLKVVIQSLLQWGRSPDFSQLLPFLLQNLPIFMEISRQACLLDPAHLDTTEKSISLFKAWFVESNVLTGRNEQECWQEYMKNIALFFIHVKNDSTEELRNKIHEIAQKCFRVYFFFAVEFASAMSSATWIFLQNIFMEITVEIAQRASAEPLYVGLFRVLFVIWVRSPCTTRAMWRDFYSKIGWLINRKAAIEMWAETIVQLTHIMKVVFYPIGLKVPDLNTYMDPFYTTISWTKKTIVSTWMSIFYTFEDFNDTHTAIYELFMKLLLDISQILLSAEEEDPDPEPPLSIYNFILPILKDIVTRPGVPTPRVVSAYRTFCAIFVMGFNVITMKYTNALRNAANNDLSPRSREKSQPISPSASKIISAYNSTLCDFYEFILKGLEAGIQAIAYEVIPSCVKIFGLQLPEGERLIIPVLTAIWNMATERGFIDGIPQTAKLAAIKIVSSLICFPREQVKRETMARFLVSILNSNEDDEELLLCTIHSNCVIAFHELQEKFPRKEEVGAIIAGILQFTASPCDSIAEAALDSLSTLSLMYPAINALQIQCFLTVLKRLASNAETLIENGLRNRKLRDSIICRHFSCLLDWLVVDGKVDVMKSDNSLCASILTVAELALSSELFGHEEAIEAIHEAADSFVEQLAQLHNSIDSSLGEDGEEIIESPVPADHCPDNSLFYSFHDNVIWEFTDEEEGIIRLTIRKPTRKVSFKIPYDLSVAQTEEEWQKMGLEGDSHTERLFFSAKLDRFLNKIYSTRRAFTEIVGCQLSTQDPDSFPKAHKKRWSLLSVIRTSGGGQKKATLEISPRSIVTRSCGVYDFTVLRDTKSERFARFLREIDRLLPSYSSKIGVIYVGAGQTMQGEILANESGSHAYETFVKGLGNTVDLTKHTGYNGGLDTIGFTSGKKAILHSSPFEEVIFHVATMMPTVPGDRIQLNKKKHIGNDFVHIVWCESSDYNRGTIGGQFNDAHVIVYPLPDGLFRIAVHRKNVGDRSIAFFGPVMDGMILSADILSPLLRQTSVYANRNCRKLSKGYTTPYHARNTLLKQTIEKTKMAVVEEQKVKTPPPRNFDTAGSGKLRRSVSMENLRAMDTVKKKDTSVRNSLRLHQSSDSAALTQKELQNSGAKTQRQLVSLFAPTLQGVHGNAGQVGRSASPTKHPDEKLEKSPDGKFTFSAKSDNKFDPIALPNSNINININININNNNATQTIAASPPNVSVTFNTVPPENSTSPASANPGNNLENFEKMAARRRNRRSHSVAERAIADLPKFPSSPDFRAFPDEVLTLPSLSSSLSPLSPLSPPLSSSSGASLRSFFASFSKHKTSVSDTSSSLVVMGAEREKEKQKSVLGSSSTEKEREKEREREAEKEKERLKSGSSTSVPSRGRSSSAGGSISSPSAWRRIIGSGGLTGAAGNVGEIWKEGPKELSKDSPKEGAKEGAKREVIIGGALSVSGFFNRDLTTETSANDDTKIVPTEPKAIPKIPTPRRTQNSKSDTTPRPSPPASPRRIPHASPKNSPPGTPALTSKSPSGTPPSTPPMFATSPKTPGLVRRGTFNLLSGKATDFGENEGKKKRKDKDLGKALEKEKIKEKIKEKEKEKERRKEKDRAKEEKDRVKGEKERAKEEKERVREEKGKGKMKRDRGSLRFERDISIEQLPNFGENLVFDLDDIIIRDGRHRLKIKNKVVKEEKGKGKLRNSKDEGSEFPDLDEKLTNLDDHLEFEFEGLKDGKQIKSKGEDKGKGKAIEMSGSDELPNRYEDLADLDEDLEFELDDVVFKDGKQRLKIKSKTGSLPSSLRKSKSFLRALAQKWTLSSRPPSYPPPHHPGGLASSSSSSSSPPLDSSSSPPSSSSSSPSHLLLEEPAVSVPPAPSLATMFSDPSSSSSDSE